MVAQGGLAPQVEIRDIVVGPEFHGQRLDRLLVAAVPEFSRSYLQQLLEDGAVTRAGLPALKSSLKVKAGEAWTIELRATPQSQAFKPESMDLKVVYEDAHLRIIDKPVGMVVHPAPGHWSGTLMNGLLGLDSQLMDLPRAGIVHRLDKDTSGLMVVARTRQAMDALVKKIAAREVKREYLAISDRVWTGSRRKTVDLPIGRDPAQRLRMAVVDLTRNSGKTATTHFQVLAQSEQGVLVRCTLETGRTHQIRVHMASLHLPLVGDSLYGGRAEPLMPRQALHAVQLAFVHPVTDEKMSFKSTLPPDFQDLLKAWSLSYNESA
ncbi:MAG: RluA family pseudouridine synthase [Betaproteobacteria bacterium]|nr:RluA family pseudouridine synthase [Betaproteobacteria bacterium]